MFRTRLRGTAGEFFAAFFLSATRDMDVMIADSEGFDLLVRDPSGVLPGRQLKAVSVKSRVRKDAKTLTFNIQDSYDTLLREAEPWNAEPYFAFLAFHRFENPKRIHCMLVRACRENRRLFGPKDFKFRVAWQTESSENFRYFVLPVDERRAGGADRGDRKR